MRFSFIHAADLHIDSPLAALGRRDADVAARFAGAGRKAVQNLIDETINSQAAFLILAGDIFDGDWPDYATGLFFVGELARLDRADIPVFIIRGNHDAASKMSRSLNWPPNVKEFSTRKAESHTLDSMQVMLHGRSFAERNVPDDFVATYPVARQGWLNIGILHTALDGLRGHESYAPCSEDQLRQFGYDYWALGHIHKREIVARDPWIVFPGNIQGRSVRETGPKGAMRVTVDTGRIDSVEPITLDAARWANVHVDVSGLANETQILDALDEQLASIVAQSEDRPVAVRFTLTGASAQHGQLLAGLDDIQAEARSLALRHADDCWVEKIRLDIRPPEDIPALSDADALEVDQLLDDAAVDPAFDGTIKSLINDIQAKLPRELQEEFSGALAGEGAAGLRRDARALLSGSLELAGQDKENVGQKESQQDRGG